MTAQQALLPEIIFKSGNKISHNILVVLGGVGLLALLAQISIRLPFTPVPVTGQTLGVALISLLWGRSRGVSSVFLYLLGGFCGLPFFAFAQSGLSWGPTGGYLVGMLLASFLMGSLADSGWTRSFTKTWLAAFLGSCVIFACGVLVLSLFVTSSSLLMTGLLPFIPGDILKTLLACWIVRQTTSLAENK